MLTIWSGRDKVWVVHRYFNRDSMYSPTSRNFVMRTVICTTNIISVIPDTISFGYPKLTSMFSRRTT